MSETGIGGMPREATTVPHDNTMTMAGHEKPAFGSVPHHDYSHAQQLQGVEVWLSELEPDTPSSTRSFGFPISIPTSSY